MPKGAREVLLVAVLSVVVMASTLIPYLLHGSFRPFGLQHSGLEFNIGDQLTYLMWTNQVRRGGHEVANLYVHDADDRFLPHPLWWAVGMAARVMPFRTVVVYHAARLLLGVAYLLLAFALAKRLWQAATTVWTAWGLVALGGGLAWLDEPLSALLGPGARPADTWIPELWAYPSLLRYPHFAASLLLLAGAALCTIRGWQDRRWVIGGGLSLSLLALVHPYTAVTFLVVLLLHVPWARLTTRAWRPFLPANLGVAFLGLAGFGLQYWQLRAHPSLSQWFSANRCPSPPPWSYLLGLGFIGGFAAWGGWRVCRPGSTPENLERVPADAEGGSRQGVSVLAVGQRALLCAWVAAVIVLAYSGLPFERRCVEGAHLPLCLLAAPAVVALARRLVSKRPQYLRLGIAGLVLACSPASAWHLWTDVESPVGYVPPAVFTAEQAAYAAFGSNTRVLARWDLGRWLAAEGRVRIYAGHDQLTSEFDAKDAHVRRFFDARLGAARRLALLGALSCNVVVAAGPDAAM